MKYCCFALLVCMVAFCMFDAGLFVYSSFSLYFSATLFSFLLLAMVAAYTVAGKQTIRLPYVALLMLLWISYIFLHTLLIPYGEYYRLWLMVAYCCFFLALCELFGWGLSLRRTVMYIFLSGAVFQSLLCFLQFFGWAETQNNYFGITGALYNPNITAIYIALCLPFCVFYVLPKKKLLGILTVVLLLSALLLLECRTAFLGSVVVAVVFLISGERRRKFISGLSRTYKLICLAVILSAGVIAGNYLYNYKKSSADGRVFIWKLSVQMIMQKPVKGYGYGLFERNYNLHQADYFRSGQGNEAEKKNANHVYMAYNEYIEQFVEGGFAGFLFYTAFLAYLLFLSVKRKDWEAMAVVVPVILMGCVNFTIQAIPVWIILLVYGASLSAEDKYIVVNNKPLKTVIPGVAFLLLVFLLFNQQKLAGAQYNLKRAIELNREGKRNEAVDLLKRNADKAGTSEVYFRNFGKAVAAGEGCERAIGMFEKASRYTSVPDVFFSHTGCLIRMGEYERAEQKLSNIAYMLPGNLRSRYLLMQLYDTLQKKEEAERMAKEIMDIIPKTDSKESRLYKEEAAKLLQ